MRFALSIFGSFVVLSQGWAHHSFADYDRSVVHELEGVLVDVRWRNPHAAFTLRVVESNGEARDWELESSAVYLLERAGLTGSMFPVDEQVRVAGWVSTTRPGRMNVSNLLLPTGEELLFSARGTSRWSGESLGGAWDNEVVDRRQRGLYRVWSLADLGAYGRANQAMAGQLAATAGSEPPGAPELDPCMPMGMPAVMINPLPVEFVDRGDHIDLGITSFGVVRRIDLAPAADVEAVPLADLGYSAGHWVEKTLEVRTTRVGWPYVDDNGRAQTENVEIREQFSLVDDGNRLRYTQTIVDPESFAAPATVSWDWIDIGEESIEPLRCE